VARFVSARRAVDQVEHVERQLTANHDHRAAYPNPPQTMAPARRPRCPLAMDLFVEQPMMLLLPTLIQ
jgi:hypothetical protein